MVELLVEIKVSLTNFFLRNNAGSAVLACVEWSRERYFCLRDTLGRHHCKLVYGP